MNIALLLLAAMLLTNIVIIVSVQNLLVRAEISKGHLMIRSMETILGNVLKSDFIMLNHHIESGMNNLLYKSGADCAIVLDKSLNLIYMNGINCEAHNQIESRAEKAMRTDSKSAVYYGATWGIFKKQNKYAVLSAPLRRDGEVFAGMSIIYQLDHIYSSLRKAQLYVLVYILTNTAIFSIIGLVRIHRFTLKPLYRLLKRAEEYRDYTDEYFLHESESNEFGQLSKALNRMMKRITADREELKSVIASLEKANANLQKAQNDIIRAEKLASIGRLSAGIAHEIGNPIGIVIGYLGLLKHPDIGETEKLEFIERAENEINRINLIIRQLLDFSRRSGDEEDVISVHDLIHDVVRMVEFQPLTAKLDIELDLDARQDELKANPNRLRQVFLNLIINAADAVSVSLHPDDGTLSISTRVTETVIGGTSGAFLELSFTDNGTGISDEDIKNIFDPFFTTKDPGKGTGLGLSVTFQIIESLGGGIEARSEDNQEGTTFILYLPLPETLRKAKNGASL